MKLSDVKDPEGLTRRFWAKVDKSADCWTWTASRVFGYGQIALRRGNSSRPVERAHRVSYLLAHGEVPDELYICHHCDNRACVRPDHLFAGTHSDNQRDAYRKGRSPLRPRPGESNPRAQLTAAEVEEIRHRYAAGGIKQRELGSDYGITQVQVSHIIRRVQWK